MNILRRYLNQSVSASPLVLFRLLFGLMMFISIVRFWLKGWIETLYIQPKMHFSFYGFEWVKPWGEYTYLLFFICGLAAFLVMIGWKYRFSIILFFLSFTYIELMDKTTYLNHYYFVSILSFLMIFLPANANFSMDSLLRKKAYLTVPAWSIDSIKLLVSIVYFYAGLAKINSDWLFKAMPLKIWITGRYDFPIVGELLMQEPWFHYAMSWSGMLYDLSIPFLLFYKRSRLLGFILVIFFHLFTKILFPIGMFPYIMIVTALIFFDAEFHKGILRRMNKIIGRTSSFFRQKVQLIRVHNFPNQKFSLFILTIFFAFQLLFPFRYVLYPGELFWTEEGYRFSWRVMLMEKKGLTTFKIYNQEEQTSFTVNNSNFLSSFQEKQMSFQPDFILEYAHFLGDHYQSLAPGRIQVFAESYVALNGRRSQAMIDPSIDLYQIKRSWKPKQFILPFNDEISGL